MSDSDLTRWACIPVMSDEYGSQMIRVSVMFDLNSDTCLRVFESPVNRPDTENYIW